MPRKLQQRTRLVERQTPQARVERAGITVPEVAEEIRLHVSFREELLIAAETGLAGREEFLVHLRGIEAGHRSAIEAECPGRHDEVRPL